MKYKGILLLLFVGIFSLLQAQVNTDSIFQNAIKLSKNQQYEPAIVEAKTALETDKNRGDILVFIANLYSWKGDNATAITYLNYAMKVNYLEDDYYLSLTNVLLRSAEYNALLQQCDEAENNKYADVQDLLRKRMIAYSQLKRYDEGIALIENPANEQYLASESIDNLYTSLLLKRNTNIVSAYYTLDMLSNNFPSQHLGSLGYSFKLGEHTWAWRANYANRFGKNDVQLETDFYLMLQNNHYLYFNYGYGFGVNNESLFPRHRVGLEYFFPLGNQFEGSIGGRYMMYPNSDIFISTVHLAKYFGRSWISIRPFYVYKLPDKQSSLSVIGKYRLYGKMIHNYWGLELGFGNSPDDIYSLNAGGFNQLLAYRVKLERNIMLTRVSDLHIALGYTREQFGTTPIDYRNRMTFELGYKLRLR